MGDQERQPTERCRVGGEKDVGDALTALRFGSTLGTLAARDSREDIVTMGADSISSDAIRRDRAPAT